MTEKGLVADGVDYEVDCVVFASGFEVTSELKHRWGIDVIEGRNGLSLYDHWATATRPSRHDDPRFPEPVLHRLQSGRDKRKHYGELRPAGAPHRLNH